MDASAPLDGGGGAKAQKTGPGGPFLAEDEVRTTALEAFPALR